MLTLENYIIKQDIECVFEELDQNTINEGKIKNIFKKVWNWLTKSNKKSSNSDSSYRHYSGSSYRYYDDDFFSEFDKPIPKKGVKSSGQTKIVPTNIAELKNIISKNNNLESVLKTTDHMAEQSKLLLNVLYDSDDNPLAVIVFSHDKDIVGKYVGATNGKHKVTLDNSVVLLALEHDDSVDKAALMELIISISRGINKHNIVVTKSVNDDKYLRYLLKTLRFRDITYNSNRLGFGNIDDMLEDEEN